MKHFLRVISSRSSASVAFANSISRSFRSSSVSSSLCLSFSCISCCLFLISTYLLIVFRICQLYLLAVLRYLFFSRDTTLSSATTTLELLFFSGASCAGVPPLVPAVFGQATLPVSSFSWSHSIVVVATILTRSSPFLDATGAVIFKILTNLLFGSIFGSLLLSFVQVSQPAK